MVKTRRVKNSLHRKRWSKLKKRLENLFIPKLKLNVYFNAFERQSYYGSCPIPRFWIKFEDTIIFDFPKDIIDYSKRNYIDEQGYWGQNKITDLIREYIDCPVVDLLTKEFKNGKIRICSHENKEYGEHHYVSLKMMIDIFICADRRLGIKKIQEYIFNIKDEYLLKIIDKKNNTNRIGGIP